MPNFSAEPGGDGMDDYQFILSHCQDGWDTMSNEQRLNARERFIVFLTDLRAYRYFETLIFYS